MTNVENLESCPGNCAQSSDGEPAEARRWRQAETEVTNLRERGQKLYDAAAPAHALLEEMAKSLVTRNPTTDAIHRAVNELGAALIKWKETARV